MPKNVHFKSTKVWFVSNLIALYAPTVPKLLVETILYIATLDVFIYTTASP